jgi:hypothetical protein
VEHCALQKPTNEEAAAQGGDDSLEFSYIVIRASGMKLGLLGKGVMPGIYFADATNLQPAQQTSSNEVGKVGIGMAGIVAPGFCWNE